MAGPTQCKVCGHKKMAAIEADLVANVPFRELEKRYGMSTTSLYRHKSLHLTKLVGPNDVLPTRAEVVRSETLRKELERLRAESEELRGKMLEDPDGVPWSAVIASMKAQQGNIELCLRLDGELQAAQFNVVVMNMPPDDLMDHYQLVKQQAEAKGLLSAEKSDLDELRPGEYGCAADLPEPLYQRWVATGTIEPAVALPLLEAMAGECREEMGGSDED